MTLLREVRWRWIAFWVALFYFIYTFPTEGAAPLINTFGS